MKFISVVALGICVLLLACFSVVLSPEAAEEVEEPSQEIPADVARRLGLEDSPRTQVVTGCKKDVTDADLEYLKDLPQLREIQLLFCDKITDAGVTKLKKALPGCEIKR